MALTPFSETVLIAGGCVSACILAVRKLVVDIVRIENKAFQAECEEREKERQREETDRLRQDPAWLSAQKQKIEAHRALVLERKARLVAEYNSFCNKWDENAIDTWNMIEEEDKILGELADEEADLMKPA